MTHHFIHPTGTHLIYDPETETWTEEYPKVRKETWWTPDRMEAAVSIFCIIFAGLLGYALGAR